jgi:hypothetical protein
MLTIDTEDFRLQIELVSARLEDPEGPYFEWIDTRVSLAVPCIQAEGQWSVMPEELRRFQQQLQSMLAQPQPGQNAELVSIEPGFHLKLHMLDHGMILGDWRFQPVPDGACVAGTCGLDQTFLSGLVRDVESLASVRRNR